jgi:hypothetical protein
MSSLPPKPLNRFQLSFRNLQRITKAKVILPPEVTRDGYGRMNVVGYVFIFYSLVDLALNLLPPQFMNAEWEFQAQGYLVEHVWGFLFGIMLILFRSGSEIWLVELYFLQFVSRSLIFIGLLYCLLLPIGLMNTQRLATTIQANYNQELSAKTRQLEQARNQIETNPDVLTALQQQTHVTSDQIFQQLELQKQQIKNQLDAQKQQQEKTLLKNALRSNIGSLMIGITFISVWGLTKDFRTMIAVD